MDAPRYRVPTTAERLAALERRLGSVEGQVSHLVDVVDGTETNPGIVAVARRDHETLEQLRGVRGAVLVLCAVVAAVASVGSVVVALLR